MESQRIVSEFYKRCNLKNDTFCEKGLICLLELIRQLIADFRENIDKFDNHTIFRNDLYEAITDLIRELSRRRSLECRDFTIEALNRYVKKLNLK